MGQKEVWVQKASGETEPFSVDKLVGSLEKSGAGVEETEEVTAEILDWIYDGISTRQIYRKAYDLLQQKTDFLASRYKLKKAIMELGPTGYPFEHLVGKIFEVMAFAQRQESSCRDAV